jgi:hypothetical protein
MTAMLDDVVLHCHFVWSLVHFAKFNKLEKTCKFCDLHLTGQHAHFVHLVEAMIEIRAIVSGQKTCHAVFEQVLFH